MTSFPFDVWVRGGTLVTMDRERRVEAADLWIRDGRIASVGGPRPTPLRPARIVDARGAAVIPGLIQAHVHLCQALFRGRADDRPLMSWLSERIWPFEAAHDEASLKASADLGLLEMMRCGTTTILDMGTVHHHHVVVEAMEAAGIRGFTGKAMMDLDAPPGLREDTATSLSKSAALAKSCAATARVGYAFAPRFILSVTERLLRETAAMARDLEALIHTHAAEHEGERAAVRERLGIDDIEALDRAGALGPRTVIAHGVQLTPPERGRLAQTGSSIVHCPSANLKLGSGIADVDALRRDGVKVGLGADGAPCNNRMDAFTELRSAALLAKGLHRDAEALPAAEALALATIEGAAVLGLGAEIGSLEVGKRADVVVVDLEGPHQEPADGDIYGTLVYATTHSDVRHVIVDGEVLVDGREHRRLDEPDVRQSARKQLRLLEARL